REKRREKNRPALGVHHPWCFSAIPEKSVQGDCLLVLLWISLLEIKKVTTHRINQTGFEN
ncbi:hypothetical protein TorRG33x02_143070, partial [Trema orientale]